MELYQLKTFIAVAEEKNVTKAAKRLFTTPPSVSSHIKSLESELEIQLFTRTPNGMEITEKGVLLKEKADKTLSAAQDLINHATELRKALIGTLRIGISGTITFLRIGQLIQLMATDFPDIKLDIQPTYSKKMIDELITGKLDAGFAFGKLPTDPLSARFLISADLVVAIPKQYEAQIQKATWKSIVEMPWITSKDHCAFRAVLKERILGESLTFNQVFYSDDEKTKAELVASGVGLALLEKGEALQLQAQNKIILWQPDALSCDLFFAYLHKRDNDPFIQALESKLSKVWEN